MARSAQAAEARIAETGKRLAELRERLIRLRAGEPTTPDDVQRARRAARAQQEATRIAYQRLLRTHASAVSHAMTLAKMGRPTVGARRERVDVLMVENQRLRDGLVALGSCPSPARLHRSEDRLRLVWRELVEECSSQQWRGWAHALCVVTTRLIPSVRGAALTVYDHDRVAYPFAASDRWARDVEQIHQVVGEGPALEVSPAHPLLVVENIADTAGRWPGFVDMAATAGLRGACAAALPLATPLSGSLTLYWTDAVPRHDLSAAREALLADVAVSALMADLDAMDDDATAADLGDYSDVFIAAGMLSVRLGINVDDAYLRLRAHAYASGQSLMDTAQAVIDETLPLT